MLVRILLSHSFHIISDSILTVRRAYDLIISLVFAASCTNVPYAK